MRFLFSAFLLACVATCVGAALRTWVIEPPEAAWACQVMGNVPWWCPLREGGIAVLRAGALGWLAVAAGLASLLFARGRAAAVVAITAGSGSLFLFAAGAGAAGLVLGLLRAVGIFRERNAGNQAAA